MASDWQTKDPRVAWYLLLAAVFLCGVAVGLALGEVSGWLV